MTLIHLASVFLAYRQIIKAELSYNIAL